MKKNSILLLLREKCVNMHKYTFQNYLMHRLGYLKEYSCSILSFSEEVRDINTKLLSVDRLSIQNTNGFPAKNVQNIKWMWQVFFFIHSLQIPLSHKSIKTLTMMYLKGFKIQQNQCEVLRLIFKMSLLCSTCAGFLHNFDYQ